MPAADIEGLVEAATEPAHARRARGKHPEGWEPGVEWDGTQGTLTVQLQGRDPTWDDLMVEWGFDPQTFEVVEPVQFRTWDMAVGPGDVRRMFYYRATIRKRVDDATDLDELYRLVRSWKKPKRTVPSGDTALLVPWADWQLGADDYGGPETTVQRFVDSIGRIQDRWRDLRRIGVPLGRLILIGLGDLGENCQGFYAQQKFRVKLNARDQRKLVRRMIVQGVKELAPLAPEVIVPAVGGNHGENRDDSGKSFTDFADNTDVAVFEDVAEILRENPDRFGHVSFVLPNRDLTLTLDVFGTIVGFAHGHQMRSGVTPAKKAENWWADQMKSLRPVGDADVLMFGHFHHLDVKSFGPRSLIQCPALHGGSEWWDNVKGGGERAGQLTVVVGRDGWDHLKVL